MTVLGQLCLLIAFVASGYAAFACVVGAWPDHRRFARGGALAGITAVLALTAASGVLAWALLAKDFRFAYVAEYSSRLLPWHYSLSAFWVGQGGSLLLWAWLLGLLAVAYRFWPGRKPSELRRPAFGVLMAYLCFLVAIMVFAADPMRPSFGAPREGAGLSPLLQHPAMLIHPPVVFLGYAGWAIPFALAVTSLLSGRPDVNWTREARPWALFAWTVLGAGILLGAQWAYEELGWGGYWAWDPVENGSLIPWLTGTALIHASLAWQHCGALKKTACSLAFATFGLCNFATFLTRSGIFSSLHAFSRSPIGWMFLLLMIALAAGGAVLIVMRRGGLAPEKPIPGLWTREALVVISTIALLLLASVATVGTLSVPLTGIVLARKIVVGPAFYNNVLIPTGLALLATMALAPLCRWGLPPTPAQRRATLLSAGAAAVAAAAAFALGCRHPVALAVAYFAVLSVLVLVGGLALDARRCKPATPWLGLLSALKNGRRQYAGFLIHLGFVCVAVGVTGSSLGTQRREVVVSEGETVPWAGRSIRLARLIKRDLPERLVVEAELEVSHEGAAPCRLLPAQHYHLLQSQWTSEVAIHSAWSGDFYTILQSGEGEGCVRLTLVENPAMRWMWLGGWIVAAGALTGLWPARARAAAQSPAPAPKPVIRSRQTQLVR